MVAWVCSFIVVYDCIHCTLCGPLEWYTPGIYYQIQTNCLTLIKNSSVIQMERGYVNKLCIKLAICATDLKLEEKKHAYRAIFFLFREKTTTSNLWNWMSLSCLPNGIKLYLLQHAKEGACLKGMDTDVTVLKRHPYISPRKQWWASSGTQWAEVPAQETAWQRLRGRAPVQCMLMKWSIVSSFLHPPPTHTCSLKPMDPDTPNHKEITSPTTKLSFSTQAR